MLRPSCGEKKLARSMTANIVPGCGANKRFAKKGCLWWQVWKSCSAFRLAMLISCANGAFLDREQP